MLPVIVLENPVLIFSCFISLLMSKHSEIGVKGEQIAADYLLNKGYTVLHRNWRSKRKEIDIIAVKDDILAIVEIKTRSRSDLSFPEETVTHKKQQYLKI